MIFFISQLTRQTSLVFHSVAETAPLGGNNRTDISSILEHAQLPDNQLGGVKFIKHFRSKETGKCDQYEIIFKPTIQPGVYDLLYQGKLTIFEFLSISLPNLFEKWPKYLN